MKTLAIILALFLTGCVGNVDLVEKARGMNLTVADANNAAKVYKAAGNPAGVLCMEYFATRMQEIVDLALPKAAERGPLTKAAIQHSAIEAMGTIRSRGPNEFNANCGGLWSQYAHNAGGFLGVVRRLLTGGLL